MLVVIYIQCICTHVLQGQNGVVVQGIQGSLARLGLPAVDLVQFYWHNYQVPKYVATSQYLMEEVAKGTVQHLGVTNFDTIRLQQMMSGGATIVSNQVHKPLGHRYRQPCI